MRVKKRLGLFEKGPAGLLIPTRKILAPTPPPKPAMHVGKDGRVTEISKSVLESTYDDVKKHYEAKNQKAIVSKSGQKKLRDMISRAGDAVMDK